MRDAVLFDLDNTLFDVEQYMSGAFADVAAHLAAEYDVNAEQVHADLLDLWHMETSMYPNLFDDIAANRDIDANINQLVAIFNHHEPALEPYEGVPELLDNLQQTGYTLGIITDGTAHRQRRKLDVLGLQSEFETVVLTDEVGESKPSALPYKEAAQRINRDPNRCIYIGDNPRVDFIGAKEAGMATIRLRQGEFSSLPSGSNVDVTLNTVEDVYEIVTRFFSE